MTLLLASLAQTINIVEPEQGDLQPVASSGSWAGFIPGLLLCSPQELAQAVNLLQRQARLEFQLCFNSLLSKIHLKWISTVLESLGDPEDGGIVRQGFGFSSAPVELLNLLQVTEHGNMAKADRKIIYRGKGWGKLRKGPQQSLASDRLFFC